MGASPGFAAVSLPGPSLAVPLGLGWPPPGWAAGEGSSSPLVGLRTWPPPGVAALPMGRWLHLPGGYICREPLGRCGWCVPRLVAGRLSLNNPILGVVACTWCGAVWCCILVPRWEVEPPPSYICQATFALGEAPPGGGSGSACCRGPRGCPVAWFFCGCPYLCTVSLVVPVWYPPHVLTFMHVDRVGKRCPVGRFSVSSAVGWCRAWHKTGTERSFVWSIL